MPLAAVILMAVSFSLYWKSLTGQFLWDDHFLVLDNLLIRSPRLILECFRHNLGYDPSSNFYRPIQTISYFIDFWRGNFSPLIYHQTNIFIHGLNAILILAYLVKRTAHSQLNDRTFFAAFFITLFWAVHPIHSATVAYIAGRADSLALLFLLLTWCLWEKVKKSVGLERYLWSAAMVVTAFCAICSKEAALAGIGLFLINVLFLEKNLDRKTKIAAIIGIVVIMACYVGLRFSIQSVVDPATFYTPLSERPRLVIRALGDYLRLLVFPDNLRMERQITVLPNLYVDPATFDPLYPHLSYIGIIFLAILIASYFKRGTLQSHRRFGVLWFAITLLPVSNVFSLNSTVAEHWLYLPSIGLLILGFATWMEASPKIQRVSLILIFIWVTGLSARTLSRVNDWIAPITFFENTIRSGGDTARMRVNLANEYRLAGRFPEGEALLRKVVQASPDYFQAKHALIANLQIQGKTQGATKLLGENSTSFGNSFSGQIYSAHHLLASGDLKAAAQQLKELEERYPDSWLVTKETLSLFEKVHQREKAQTFLETFTAKNKWHSPSMIALGDVYADRGEMQLAKRYYQSALNLDPRNTQIIKRMTTPEETKK